MIVAELALECELNRGGVEWRSIVELHAAAQRKGVSQSIRTHVPFFGQPGNESRSVRSFAHERLDNLFRGPTRVRVSRVVGVECGGLRTRSHYEGSSGLAGRRWATCRSPSRRG